MVYVYIVQRTQIYLTQAELRALDRAVERTGRTRSALIREAVAKRFGTPNDRDTLLMATRATEGAWGHTISAVERESLEPPPAHEGAD